jgi:hypothetical protein
LLSLSRMRYLGVYPYGVASRSCCAVQASVGDRVTPTWMTLRDFSSMMKRAFAQSIPANHMAEILSWKERSWKRRVLVHGARSAIFS